MIWDCNHIDGEIWFLEAKLQIDEQLMKNRIIPQKRWNFVWTKSFVLYTLQNSSQLCYGKLAC
jgi:hypothetical protein